MPISLFIFPSSLTVGEVGIPPPKSHFYTFSLSQILLISPSPTDNMVVKCTECKLEVASKAALVAHWEEQRAENKKHYHCSKCVVLFHTPEGEDRHHKEVCT